jgi:alcohol dehydrogenase class IV
MDVLSQSFDLQGPDALVFGRGRVAELGDRAAAFGSRALVVTDPGIRDAGLLDPVLESLDAAGLSVEVFDGVDADPTVSNAAAAGDAAVDAGADVLVGVGGGSSMDVTKVAALAADSPGPLADLLANPENVPTGLPTILLPTTAGTGSEVSPAAVLLDDETGEKEGLIDPELFAAVALVDPDFTMHLPTRITRATGLDAFAHAAGSYISTDANEFADALCLNAMELVEDNLRDAAFHGADAPQARVAMSMAATTAMYGRVNGGKSAIHSVAYGIQAMYDRPHAEAIALVMPVVLDYDAPAAVDRFARLGERVFDATGPRRERAQAAVDGVRALRDDLDLPSSLSDVGGSADDLDELAELAVHSERHLRANPRPMTAEDARDVLETLL